MNKHRTRVIIDQNALRHNVKHVKRCAPNSPIIAMVKAEAYGHGIERIIPTLAPYVSAFGVACLEEAKALRTIEPHKPILLMEGVFAKEDWKIVVESDVDVVFHDFWQVGSFLSLRKKPLLNAWIKIDTGMHRLGFKPEDVPAIYAQLSACQQIQKPIGLMTHFACADEINSPMTMNQIALFQQTIQKIADNSNQSNIKVSMANSAGVIAWSESHAKTNHLNYVRPGIMLYGVSPFADKTGTDLGLKPVMTLQSHINAVKICKKGESIGYGATWRATEDCRIAIVAAGYGDGYPRHVSKEAVVWAENRYLPIVGRISMDMLAIDVSNYPEAKTGRPIELWGEHLPVEQVARFSNTSPYELVTQVCSRAR